MSPIKENTVRTQKISYRHRNKNGSKGDAIRKMHTKHSSSQTNFTRNINSVRFKWGRLSQIWDKIFCLYQTDSSQDWVAVVSRLDVGNRFSSLPRIKKLYFSTHYYRKTQALSSRTKTSEFFCEWTCLRHIQCRRMDFWRLTNVKKTFEDLITVSNELVSPSPSHEDSKYTSLLSDSAPIPWWKRRGLLQHAPHFLPFRL